jgi:hypothetical protein
MKAVRVLGRASVVQWFQRQIRELAVEAICLLAREWHTCSNVHRD